MIKKLKFVKKIYIQTYFQGSDSTTPKDVEDIFKKAEGRLEGLKNDRIKKKVRNNKFNNNKIR